MYYAANVNGQIVRCNISDHVPVGTFAGDPTEEQLAPYGVVIVHDAQTLPTFDATTHGLVDVHPTQGSDGKWYASYDVIERGPEPTPPGPLAPPVA